MISSNSCSMNTLGNSHISVSVVIAMSPLHGRDVAVSLGNMPPRRVVPPSACLTRPLRRMPPVNRDLDMAEVQAQVLDGVRQAAPAHTVAGRMPADGGQLLRGLAG